MRHSKSQELERIHQGWAARQVYLPERAPWLPAYVHEILTFPNGKYDDQVDSTSQALNWFKGRAYEPGIVTYYREQAVKACGKAGLRISRHRCFRICRDSFFGNSTARCCREA